MQGNVFKKSTDAGNDIGILGRRERLELSILTPEILICKKEKRLWLQMQNLALLPKHCLETKG